MIRGPLSLLGRIRFAVPFLMLGIGYNVAALRAPVGWPDGNELWAALFVSLVVMVVWLAAEAVTVASRYTTSGQLQADDFVSIAVALVITYFAGWQRNELEWYVVIPWIGAVLDGILAGYLGINNAAQKPFAPHEKAPHGPFRGA